MWPEFFKVDEPHNHPLLWTGPHRGRMFLVVRLVVTRVALPATERIALCGKSTLVDYRLATSLDAAVLARLNKDLIVDEGHHNPMSVAELESRMSAWLTHEYTAVLFLSDTVPVGYALFRREPDHVYLRQFFVSRASRRTGVGRAAVTWLRQNVWSTSCRIRLDVLVGNATAIAFWRSVGFSEYCLTMEHAAEFAG